MKRFLVTVAIMSVVILLGGVLDLLCGFTDLFDDAAQFCCGLITYARHVANPVLPLSSAGGK